MPSPSLPRRHRTDAPPPGHDSRTARLGHAPHRSWTPALVAAGILLGAMVGSGAVAVAGANSSSPTYYACLSSHGTLFRVGTAPRPCSGRATMISWNATGPRGAVGPRGAPGSPGAVGPQGATGPPGPAGIVHDCSSVPGPLTAPGSDFAECNFEVLGGPTAEYGVDLTGDDLIGADLAGFSWTDTQMTGANLTGAFLANGSLIGSTLVDAQLVGADLADVAVAPEDLVAGQCWAGRIVPTSLVDAGLAGADLRDAQLSGVLGTGADLVGADLTGATIGSWDCLGGASGPVVVATTLAGADLAGADLTDADLTGAELAGANLTGVVWTGATCPDGTPSADDPGGTCLADLG